MTQSWILSPNGNPYHHFRISRTAFRTYHMGFHSNTKVRWSLSQNCRVKIKFRQWKYGFNAIWLLICLVSEKSEPSRRDFLNEHQAIKGNVFLIILCVTGMSHQYPAILSPHYYSIPYRMLSHGKEIGFVCRPYTLSGQQWLTPMIDHHLK